MPAFSFLIHSNFFRIYFKYTERSATVCQNKHTHSFGITQSPDTFSEKANFISELLRFL